FLDHLFGTEDKPSVANGGSKNPNHVATKLDQRDIFLLESFQISNGAYEDAAHLKLRIKQATDYRRRFGARIFAITTTTDKEPFAAQKFADACKTASTAGLDGFGWGEPNFSASDNMLRDHHCELKAAAKTAAHAESGHFRTSTNGSSIVRDHVHYGTTFSA